MEKVVLAYSGGLDTSVILHWLSYEKGYEVIAYCGDVGQKEDFEKVKRKAKESGAEKVVIEDLKEKLAKVAKEAIAGNVEYENGYLLGTALARPLIAEGQVKVALAENAEGVAHGATGKGNDQIRFELSYAHLAPELKVIAPWKEKEFLKAFKSREDLKAYAEKNGVEVGSVHKSFSIDENLLHTSYEGGVLESPVNSSKFLYKVKESGEVEITLGFEGGLFSYLILGGKKYGGVAAFHKLKEIGEAYVVGVIDIVENRTIGLKSRGVYFQAPLALPHSANLYLQGISLPKSLYHYKLSAGKLLGKLVYEGKWFSPLAQHLLSYAVKANESVEGEVNIVVHPHGYHVLGGKAKNVGAVEKGGFSMEDFSPEEAKVFIKFMKMGEVG